MMDQAEKLRQAIDNLKLKQAMNHTPIVIPQIKRKARVITVTSGKGGVGKTNVTINLAIALSEQGYRVVILDADFGLANVDVLFGIVPKYTLLNVIRNEKNILEIISEGPMNTRFISGGSGVVELIELDRQQVLRFVESIALLDKLADIIIIDTGAGLSENIMSFIMAADEVLLITTPEPTSITDAYSLIKTVSNREKSKKIRLIVNRADSVNEANDVLNKLELVAEKFLGIKVEPLGYIMHDEAVEKAVRRQKPFFLTYPKSIATRNIRDISARLTDKNIIGNAQMGSGMRGFMNRLIGLMKA
jgi:flagellar biosynthesis protein FlhG